MAMSKETLGCDNTNSPILNEGSSQLEKKKMSFFHNAEKDCGNHAEENKLETTSIAKAVGNEPKEIMEAPVFKIPDRFTKNGRKKAVSFPLKLMHILSHKEYEDSITWLPDGKSFQIIDREAFTTFVLPKHFKEAKYSSFTRKLLRWGFQYHKTRYVHEFFQKNRHDLIDRMTCQSHHEKVARFPVSNGQYLQPNTTAITMNGCHAMAHQEIQTSCFQHMSRSRAPPLALAPSSFPSVNQTLGADKTSALKAIDDELLAVRSLIQKKKIEAASLPSSNSALSMNARNSLPSIDSNRGAVSAVLFNSGQSQVSPTGSDSLPPVLSSSVPVGAEEQTSLPGVTSQEAAATSHYNDPGKIDPLSIEMEIRRRVKERMEASVFGSQRMFYP